MMKRGQMAFFLLALLTVSAVEASPIKSVKASCAELFAQEPATTADPSLKAQADQLFKDSWALYLKGDLQGALEKLNQALPHYRRAVERKGEAEILFAIGAVYSSMGNKQKALDYYNQSLLIKRAISDNRGEAITLNNISGVYDSLGEKQKALDYLNQALPIFRAVGDRAGEASTLNNIGGVYYALDERQKALDHYNQALPLWRSVGDRGGEAHTLNNIGGVYNSLGEKQKALDYYDHALPVWRAVGHRVGEATTLSNIGYLHENQKDFRQALDFYRQAIAVREKIRATASLEEIKSGLAEQSVGEYQRAVLLLMRLGQSSQAFDLNERARARTLLDQLGNARLDIRKGADLGIIQQEQSLLAELTALEQKLGQESAKPANQLNAALVQSLMAQATIKQRQYEDLLTRLKLTNPEYASLRSVDPLTLADVQKLLDKDTTLLSYYVTPDETLAFVITRNSFHAVLITVNEGKLQNQIASFRAFADLDDIRPSSLKQLYDWLIAPLKAHLKTPVVGIIPHGVLHYLPFAALTDGRQFLSDNYTLFHLPSASALQFIQQKRKAGGNRLLALAQGKAEGLPILQHAEREAQTVAKLFNTQALVGGAATESEFVARAADSTILHLAAHGEFRANSPLFSRIVLASDAKADGSLEVREVYGLNLARADLVVLSACQTQLGAQSRGDDIVGLNRAFMYAGTPTVVASLWNADDEATGFLMKSFYTHLKQGKGKAAALRAAQRETRIKYTHPHYWASFVLTGDPGAGRNF